MKCLIVTTLDRQISLFLLPHMKLLHEMGYDVTAATAITNRQQLQKKAPSVDFQHIPFSRSIVSPSNLVAFFKIRKLLRKEPYSFIHVHTPIAAFITRMAALKNQQIIYTAHGFHFNENGSIFSNRAFYLAEKAAAKKTNKLIVMNEEDYLKGKEFMNAKQIHQIKGIGVDTAHFNGDNYTHDEKRRKKEKWGIPKNYKVITHIAEFNENKRQIDIVEAAEKLKAVYEKFVILLVGDGVLLEEIKQQLTKRNLTDHVRCLGFREDIRDILSITDIGMLVSIREGLPKSLMEMMAMEIPIVATDIRGSRELVKDGNNGFLIPIKSPDQLMHALHTLLEREELCLQMGTNGRKKVVRNYDLKNILEETKKVYQYVDLKFSDKMPPLANQTMDAIAKNE